jgi:hypothetical protein
MTILQPIVHYSLHFLAPGFLAYFLFKDKWKTAWLIMIATMFVDLDHIFACSSMFPVDGSFVWTAISHLAECTEIFVPGRCSIGFHPLHSYPAIIIYGLLLFFPKTRVVAVGLLFHMLTDYQDCLWL